MMNILSTRREGILVLTIEGRLDAQGAIELEDFLNTHIVETDRTAVFDVAGVGYLSSAGIRILIATEKKMKQRNGCLHISHVQPYPLSVLDMTGFSTVLSLHPTLEDAIRAARSMLAVDDTPHEHDTIPFHLGGAEYMVTRTGSDENTLEITGHPSVECRYEQGGEMAIPVTVSTDACSMGRGAPGQQPGDSAEIMGDLLTIGNIAVWLTPDGHGIPDYLILDKKKRDIPLTTSFLISSSGASQYLVRMRSDSEEGVTLSDLLDALSGIAVCMEPRYKGVLSFSFCAESPYVSTYDPASGEQRTAFPKESPGSILAGCAIAVDAHIQQSQFRGAVTDLLVHRLSLHHGTLPRISSLLFRELPMDSGISPCMAVEQGLTSGAPAVLRHLSPRTKISGATIHLSTISDILLNMGTDVIIEGDIRGWNPDYERIVKILHHDCSEVHLHPISGGYSGSLVFRDDAYDRNGRREMPFVLKLDRWKNIQDEIDGYEGHVKRYIQNNATQIIQHEQSGDHGGILYTFVGIQGPQSRIFSLEDFYLSHPTEEVLAVFDILFRKVLRAWYGQPRLRDLPLYRTYADIYNYEGVKRWAVSRYGISPADEFINLPFMMGRSCNPLYFMEFILPERLSRNWSVYEGSVHGDLNMKNVLMDEERNIWLIDFAMTGHSHILRDIAKLESVLKFEMIPISSEERLLDIFSFEKAFLRPEKIGEIPKIPEGTFDTEIIKAFTVVRQLRRYADTITLLDEDIRQYYLALLYYTLCVPAFVSVNDYMREYAWISSSYLCNALKE